MFIKRLAQLFSCLSAILLSSVGSAVLIGRAMPETALIPYPVVSANFRTERWWMHGATARLLLFEYVKFLPSAARFCVARLLGWDKNTLSI